MKKTNLKMYISVIFVLSVICSISSAQDYPSGISEQSRPDTALAEKKGGESEYQPVKLRLSDKIASAKYFLGFKYPNLKYSNLTYSGFLYPQSAGENKPLSKAAMKKLQKDFSQTFIMLRNAKIKTDLGVFGRILGYSQAAAALGLAVYHVYKYGFK